jgi:hypothetical protein
MKAAFMAADLLDKGERREASQKCIDPGRLREAHRL